MDSLRRIINTSNNNIANISQAQKEQHTPPTVDFVKSLTPLFELIQKAGNLNAQVKTHVSEGQQPKSVSKEKFSFEGVHSMLQVIKDASNMNARVKTHVSEGQQPQSASKEKFTFDGVNSVLRVIQDASNLNAHVEQPKHIVSLQRSPLVSLEPYEKLMNIFANLPKLQSQDKKNVFSGLSLDKLRAMLLNVWYMNRKPNLSLEMDKWRGLVNDESESESDNEIKSESENGFQGGRREPEDGIETKNMNKLLIANEMTPSYVAPNVPDADNYDFIGTFGPPIDVTETLDYPQRRTRLYWNRETREFYNEFDFYDNNNNNDNMSEYSDFDDDWNGDALNSNTNSGNEVMNLINSVRSREDSREVKSVD
jgi:hypothetical protein